MSQCMSGLCHVQPPIEKLGQSRAPCASRKARYLLDGTQSIHPQKHDNWFMDKTKAPALQKRLLWHQYVVARFKSLECTLLPESHVKAASNY